jgi:hypothetical protein
VNSEVKKVEGRTLSPDPLPNFSGRLAHDRVGRSFDESLGESILPEARNTETDS